MLRQQSCFRRVLGLIFTLFLMSPAILDAATKPKEEVLVAAAASLKELFEELGTIFHKKYPDIQVSFQFAASGALQQQVEQGAPLDIFVSASERQVQALEQKDLVVKGSVRQLLSNELVLIVPKDQAGPKTLADLKQTAYKRLAIGESRTVPAGQYAEAWLQNAGLLETLRERLVPASNVRQVLTFVETGNVSAGFVYASDALVSSKVKIALHADPTQHPPIVYPMALLKRSQKQKAATSFTEFLESSEARTIILKHGFRIPTEKAS